MELARVFNRILGGGDSGVVTEPLPISTARPIRFWIVYANSFNDGQAGKLGVARKALMKIYSDCRGISWYQKKNWGTNQPLSKWYGIRSDYETQVPRCVCLNSNNLHGTFPDDAAETLLSICGCVCAIEGNTHLKTAAISRAEQTTWDEDIKPALRPAFFISDSSGGVSVISGRVRGIWLDQKVQVDTFPDQICFHSQLLVINLANNQLKSLGNGICTLSLLKILEAPGNCITSLPDHIGRLQELEDLDMSRNCLMGIPASFGNLVKLKYVNLSENQLLSLPSCMFELTDNITVLNLSSNALDVLPDEICCLDRLCELYVQSNRLVGLPDDLGSLPRLQLLQVSHNHIASLPESIGELRRLKDLRADDNQLKSLPDSICSLRSLVCMSISQNRIEQLPDEFEYLTTLVVLDLHNNALAQLPNRMSRLSNLEVLNVSSNQLASVPSGVCEMILLRELHVHHNRITEFSRDLGKLRGLMWIFINSNPANQQEAKDSLKEVLDPLCRIICDAPEPKFEETSDCMSCRDIDELFKNLK